MRVLVTRPEEDARGLIEALEARGHEALVEPMLTIAPAEDVASPLDLTGVQALLFTSANGVRVFARLSEARGLPVFAVGDASAGAARDAGFERVESADGDVADLARLVIARLDPKDGALYQAAASRLAGDLKGALEAAGFTLRREVLYQAKAVADLSAGLRRELAEGRLDATAFFSPRTAATFVGLVEKRGLGDACAPLTALCLSEAVAAKLRALVWREVLVAERPNQEAVLARLDALAASAPAASASAPAAPAGPGPEDQDMTGAHRVIAHFGGIRPMASTLGVAVSTVQGWRERGAIPARHHQRVLGAAKQHGVEIDPSDFAEQARTAAPKPKSKPRTEPKPRTELRTEQSPERRTEQPPETQSGPGPAPGPPPGPAPGLSPGTGPKSGPAEPEHGRATLAPVDRRPGRRWRGKGWLSGAALGALVLAAVLAAGAGGALVTRDLWMPWVDAEYGVPDDTAIQDFERRVAARESTQASPPPQDQAVTNAAALNSLGQDLGDLSARLEDSEARLSELAVAPPGASLGASPGASPAASPGASSALDEESAARLAELSARLEELAARQEDLAAPEQPLDVLPELVERVDALAGRVEELAALAGRVDALSALGGRVEALAGTRAEAGTAPGGAVVAGAAAFTLGVLQLREALRGSGPFTAELGLLQDLAASGAIEDGAALERLIAPLAPHAESGIPSLARLKAKFRAVARAVVVQPRSGAEGDWIAGVKRRVSNLVTLRPVGRVEGESAGAVVARAEDQVAADDLAAALAELDALSGAAAEAARPWRDQAAARLAARQALTGLGSLLVARLEPAGG